jgi:hypothetical protein
MNSDTFINISKIIEQESKTSTYKFALLRGTIELTQEYSPYTRIKEGRVFMPMGLLINKWIFYYYPLIEGPYYIPQINGSKPISFEKELREIIETYSQKGDMPVLYNELRINSLEKTAEELLIRLYKKLQKTISSMPMKYLGSSINQSHYSIFSYHSPTNRSTPRADRDFVTSYGEFSIPLEYYDAFRILGSFINGQDSIISRWADFCWSSSNNGVKEKSIIISKLISSPITEREVNESKTLFKKIYKERGSIDCVWTGKSITNIDKYDLDHLLPFSVWRNNDMWNLLPANPIVNKQKSDRIPSPSRLENASSRIFQYWSVLHLEKQTRFKREIEQALLGKPLSNGWEELALDRLKKHSEYLIRYRGYEQW